MVAGGIAAILASSCCLGPLVLVSLGLSGAWIGNLSALEPYRPWMIGPAIIALGLAWRSIFRPASDCADDAICAAAPVRQAYKILFWLVSALVVIAIGFPYALPLFY